MYSADKRETIKVMRKMDMSTPRTINRILIALRDTNEALLKANKTNKKYWFNEDTLKEALKTIKAETMTVGTSDQIFYYVENWEIQN